MPRKTGQPAPDEAAGVEKTRPFFDPARHSPLLLVTTEPTLNQFVVHLQQVSLRLQQDPDHPRHLEFSKSHLEQVRAAFARMILQGEETLHRLSQLLCDTFFESYKLQSVVIGETDTTRERFTLIQDLLADDLYSTMDIDLGTRQLEKLRLFDGQQWATPLLVANMVDYQPTTANAYSIHKIISRIKAEEEIWNKVVDEIFDLDSLVTRDKKLRQYSRYVKDIFGLKIVVGDIEQASQVQATLEALRWDAPLLRRHQIRDRAAARRLDFVEVKDYLGPGQGKETGWEAINSVVRWHHKTFEIQIQTLRNFLREREYLTRESHASFKAKRERVRAQVAEQLPLFGFYQELLRWLFLQPEAPPPDYPGVTLRLVD